MSRTLLLLGLLGALVCGGASPLVAALRAVPGRAAALPVMPPPAPVLADDPATGRLALAWLGWEWTPAGWSATVWARVRSAEGRWETAQAVSTAPIRPGGGLALAWRADGALVVAYGDGAGAVWLCERAVAGWSQPERLGSGELRGLAADPAGALHVLLLATQGQPRYGVRVPGARWAWSSLGDAPAADGQLALLIWPDDPAPAPRAFVVRRFALLRGAGADGALVLLRSEDGRDWTRVDLPRASRPSASSLIAVLGPDGTGIVGVAWSQRVGGVFAALSLDSGLSFGAAEPVLADRTVPAGQVGLAYDQARFRLALSWVEAPGGVRTRLAVRELAPDAALWRRAQLPADPTLTRALERAATLWGSTTGERHWLVSNDVASPQTPPRVLALDLATLAAEVAP